MVGSSEGSRSKSADFEPCQGRTKSRTRTSHAARSASVDRGIFCGKVRERGHVAGHIRSLISIGGSYVRWYSTSNMSKKKLRSASSRTVSRTISVLTFSSMVPGTSPLRKVKSSLGREMILLKQRNSANRILAIDVSLPGWILALEKTPVANDFHAFRVANSGGFLVTKTSCNHLNRMSLQTATNSFAFLSVETPVIKSMGGTNRGWCWDPSSGTFP